MAAESSAKIRSKTLSGLHLLLTYSCNYECDHCFVWGGPSQSGTMTIETIEHILAEAEALGSIKWIYFEGGEAFLYYQIMRTDIRLAKKCGFNVGIVSNAYWATADTDAIEWLKPLAGSVDDLSISSDAYHGSHVGLNHPEIVRRYDLPHEDGYADHCHLCYTARSALRERFPDVLTPDQMYGTI